MSKKFNYEQVNQISRTKFLERVARMYYVLELTQQEIADILGIGRATVTRALDEARKRRLIHFQIGSPMDMSRCTAVEKRMLDYFPLKECVVFDLSDELHSFETLACAYLDSVLPFEGAVGLGWGKTLLSVGQHLHLAEDRPNLQLVQITGSSGLDESIIPTSSIVQSWSQSLRSKSLLFPAPAIAKDPKLKELIMQDPSIQRVLETIRGVSVAVVGIGHMGLVSPTFSSYDDENFAKEIEASNCKGNVLLHFYDIDGHPCKEMLSTRLVGVSRHDYLNIPLRIGLAYGRDKLAAITGALRGNLVNILLTTRDTAEGLLEGRW
jgi:deoxyribonucleoside regulator